ncbi:hypothetical protein RQP46_000518 [Phenoliferia psychrophenolica]
MSNLSSPPPSTAPTTLPDALVQLAALRARLSAMTRAIHRVTGFTLDELLEKGGEGAPPPASEPAKAAGDATVASSTGDGPAPAEAEVEAVDISPFVLKALAIRKAIAGGSMTEEEAEAELKTMLPDGLAEEQVATVRQWSGL